MKQPTRNINLLRLVASITLDPQNVPSDKWLRADGAACVETSEGRYMKALSRITDEKLRDTVDEAAVDYRGAIETWAFERGMRAGADLMLELFMKYWQPISGEVQI